MAETPFEQEELADATYGTVELTVLLVFGAVTVTCPPLPTVIVIGVTEAPPQLSHSSTTVSYTPGLRVSAVSSLAPGVVYAS
jgi:hypothetical protein